MKLLLLVWWSPPVVPGDRLPEIEEIMCRAGFEPGKIARFADQYIHFQPY
jgi:hypothetical protein